MLLEEKQVLKLPILSVSKWAEKYGEGIANSAVNYLMNNDIIDYVLLGSFRYVVLTEKTLQYEPIKSEMREEKNRKKKKLLKKKKKTLINGKK